MVHIIFHNLRVNITASPTTDQSSIQEELAPLPFEAIIPIIEEEWKDEEYAYGELYDRIYSKLSATSVWREPLA